MRNIKPNFNLLPLFVSVLLFTTNAWSLSVERERPEEWKDLVNGGQFKDLFQPMPVRKGYTSMTWGGTNVKPRDITNGIEDPEWSYWGGFPHLDEESGIYHLFVSRWREDHPEGHFGYFDSEIVHAISEDPMGPFIYKDHLGFGHNPELLQLKNGKFIIYSAYGVYYESESLDGPWSCKTYDYHRRERWCFPSYVNFSFAPRDDGSFIAVSRRGYIWASTDGGEHWYQVTQDSVYPKVPGIFEDPVMWKDDIQYHIIVNDWKGRIAYYLRSKNGFHWKTEPGEAYVPGIAKYEDGTVSDWYKFERIRFLQDKQGRPTHAYFAVIDSDKYADDANDIHNSKMIVIPMTVPCLLEVLNENKVSSDTSEIKVLIKAESQFNPQTDIDLDSLRFGASDEVNYGRGSKVLKSIIQGNDLLLTFSGKDSGFNTGHFAGKLIGKNKKNELLFGWVALPECEAKVPMLSSLAPKFEYENKKMVAYIEIENFGEVSSSKAKVNVIADGHLLGLAEVRPLKPFEKTMVRVVCKNKLTPESKKKTSVSIELEGYPTETFTQNVVVPEN